MVKITTVGIVLLFVGALTLIYVGFNYSRREKVLDAGPIHVTMDNDERSSLPLILGGVALVGGIAMVVVGAKQKA